MIWYIIWKGSCRLMFFTLHHINHWCCFCTILLFYSNVDATDVNIKLFLIWNSKYYKYHTFLKHIAALYIAVTVWHPVRLIQILHVISQIFNNPLKRNPVDNNCWLFIRNWTLPKLSDPESKIDEVSIFINNLVFKSCTKIIRIEMFETTMSTRWSFKVASKYCGEWSNYVSHCLYFIMNDTLN